MPYEVNKQQRQAVISPGTMILNATSQFSLVEFPVEDINLTGY